MSRILALRKEKAALLGYNTYAELSVSQKMAKNVGQVQRLLDELHRAAKPAADREMKELAAFANSRGCVCDIVSGLTVLPCTPGNKARCCRPT